MKIKDNTFIKNFLTCGITGWCIEILFTALGSLRRRDFTLKGVTSVWMFPIYGLGAILSPLSHMLRRFPTWFRGLTYMSMIFSVEYLSGRFLSRHNLCPWNYARSRWNIQKVIRLDYAPCWFGTGLLFERLLSGNTNRRI
ncbi:MAG: hypothetical protein ACI4HQ_09765 [Acetatifactor sp.]